MSVFFTVCVIGKESLLSKNSVQLVNLLDGIGFDFNQYLSVVDYDKEMECFVDLESLGYSPMRLFTSTNGIDDYNGLCLSCNKGGLTLNFRLVNYKEYSYCFLDIVDRDLYKLFQVENSVLFKSILKVNTRSIDTIVGIGAMELEWEPYTSDELKKYIITGPPNYEGKPPPLGIVSTNEINNLTSKYNDIYDLSFLLGNNQVLFRKGVVKQFASIANLP